MYRRPNGRRAAPMPPTLVALWRAAGRRLAERALATVQVALGRRRPIRVPPRLSFQPLAFVEPDGARAADIYAGVFALAGKVVDAGGQSPFAVAPPSDAFARALHGFAWLHPLSAEAGALASTNAQALMEEWLDERHGPPAHEPDVAAERLLAWLANLALLLTGADAPTRRRTLRALARQMAQLERSAALRPCDLSHLQATAALTVASLATRAPEGRVRKHLSALTRAVEANVLPDGSHASRAPEALFAALKSLLRVRHALVASERPLPPALTGAIERMWPMLRFMRHADGSLAGVHGGRAVPARSLEAVLAHDDVAGAAPSSARYGGFQRLEAGHTTLLIDTGGPPPPPLGTAAHASVLSLELSHGPHRLIVGCGPLGHARPSFGPAARSSAAHSALVVDDTSSARILGSPVSLLLGEAAYGGPRAVEVERTATGQLRARHDAYRARYGLVHQRTLALSADGLVLAGEDRLIGRDRLDGIPYAIRFHFGAGTARAERRRRRVVVRLPDASVWVFAVREGPAPRLEPSVLLAPGDRLRRTVQIVIAGDTLGAPEVAWHLWRQAGPLDTDEDTAGRALDGPQTAWQTAREGTPQ